MLPRTTAQWLVNGTSKGFDDLIFQEQANIPQLGDHDCLVEIHAVSLNRRDLIVPKGLYPFTLDLPIVPCCDSAGIVLSTGPKVSRFVAGSRVCTIFYQGFSGFTPLNPNILATALGTNINGTLRQYGVFNEEGLVAAPETLHMKEASTLTCAALTAWNALFGLEDKKLRKGDVVLTQGTGGVSLAAVQFAVAAGAMVIATTSSTEKGKKLKEMGAHIVINYKEDKKWGETAKKLTSGAQGVNHIIEVGGPETISQSLDAIAIDGVVSIVGFLGGSVDTKKDNPSFLEVLMKRCTVRGISVGSRAQFEDMIKWIDERGIKPLLDQRIFKLKDARKAFEIMWEQKNLGKVVIEVKDSI